MVVDYDSILFQTTTVHRHRRVPQQTRLHGTRRLPELVYETHRGSQRKTHEKVSIFSSIDRMSDRQSL